MDLSEAVSGFLNEISSFPYEIVRTGLVAASNWNNGSAGIFSVLMRILNTSLKPISEALKVYGLCMLCIFFLISLIELGVSERMNLETFMKHFVKLCVGFWAVSSTDWITSSILALSSEINDVINGEVASLSGAIKNGVGQGWWEQIKGNLNNGVSAEDIQGVAQDIMSGQTLGWLFSFLIGIINLIPMMLIALCEIIVMLILNITRVLEFTIRGVFLPIGVALLAEDGWHGSGGRYIKKYLSCGIQTSLYIIIAAIGVQIVSSAGMSYGFLSTWATFSEMSKLSKILQSIIQGMSVAFIPIASGIAAIAAMFKASQYTNEILGC